MRSEVLDMALSRLKIGDIITVCDERNRDGENYPFYGINISKEFMPSVANTQNVDKTKYKIVRYKRFVFSGMQTGRDNCIRISMYAEHNPILVSPAYTTFEVTNSNVLPEYFFMIFQSKEMDRYGAFLSDSSVRANLDWDRFCDIELEIPSLEIQKKYVAIYESLLANMRSYEKGLNDLKLVCDSYIEKLRTIKRTSLKGCLKESDERNELLLAKSEKGVSIQKSFIDTKAKAENIKKQKLVRHGFFAFNSNTSRNSDTISIALNDGDPCAVSGTYVVFSCTNKILPEYLYLWFKRKEFDRFARFNFWGSARETISLKDFEQAEIAIPELNVQKNIIEILSTYQKRKNFVETIKKLVASICPILIRGSILEERRKGDAL